MVATVLSCLAFGTLADAQRQRPDPSTADAAQREAAREHFDEGVSFAQAQRWGEAIRELEAARDIRATPAVYFNLGMAYRAVGRPRAAIAAYRTYLTSVGAGIEARRREEVEHLAHELEATIASLRVRAHPDSATVVLDGTTLESPAQWQPVDPGSHTLTVQASGYRTATRTLDLASSQTADLEISLVSEADSSRVVVESNLAQSAIRVDGRLVGNGRIEEYFSTGEHSLEVSAPGRSTFRRTFRVTGHGESRIHVTLTDQRTIFSSPWLWTGVGAVIIGAVVVGVVLGSGIEAPTHYPGAQQICLPGGC